MNKFKQIFILSMSLAFSAANLSFSSISSNAKDSNTVNMEMLRDLNKNAYSLELYQDFVESLPKKYINNTEAVIYPDSYAGAYIDDNNVLHIKFAEDEDAVTKAPSLVDTNSIS